LIKKLSYIYQPATNNPVFFKSKDKKVYLDLSLHKVDHANVAQCLINSNSTPKVSFVFFKKFTSLFLTIDSSFFFKNVFISDFFGNNFDFFFFIKRYLSNLNLGENRLNLNLVPLPIFNYKLTKSMVSNRASFFFKENLLP
jgi:hypothetical protein